MVYKKYICKNGKLIGPYYYESYRENGKVKTKYIGTNPPQGSNKNSFGIQLTISVLILFAFILIGYLTYNYLSGNVVLEINEKYGLGENLTGEIKLSVEEGDYLSKTDSVVFSVKKDNEQVLGKSMNVWQLVNNDEKFFENVSVIQKCENLSVERLIENCSEKEVFDSEKNETIIENVCTNESVYDIVENCTTEEISDYYLAQGDYAFKIEDNLNFAFEEPGNYTLSFSIPSKGLYLEKEINIEEPVYENNETYANVSENNQTNESQGNEEIINASASNESVSNETTILNKTGRMFEIQQTNIPYCGEISMSGDYYLSENITSDGSCIVINANNVVIDCQGNEIEFGNSSETSNKYGIFVNNASNVQILNCNIRKRFGGSYNYGIYINESSDVQISYSSIYINASGNYNRGVYSDFDSGENQYINVQHSKIHIESGSNCDAIYLRNSDNSGIFNNTINLTNSANCEAVEVYLSDATNVDSNEIYLLNSASSNAVYFISSKLADAIYNNISLIGCGDYSGGITLTSSSDYSYANINNIILNCSGSNIYGISLTDYNQTISYNHIYAKGDSNVIGIGREGHTYDNTKLHSNAIEVNGRIGIYGIKVASFGNNESVYNNTINVAGESENSSDIRGIYLSSATKGFYYNNNIRLSKGFGSGVYLYNSQNVSLYNNNITNDFNSDGILAISSPSSIEYYVHNISTNNYVNSLPVYYFVYSFGGYGESPTCNALNFENQEVGHLSLIGCTFSKFSNITSHDGVTIISGLDNSLSNVKVINGSYGARIFNSLGTNISNSEFSVRGGSSYDDGYGIKILYSNSTNLKGNIVNTFNYNKVGYGAYISGSNSTLIDSNVIIMRGVLEDNYGIRTLSPAGKGLTIYNNTFLIGEIESTDNHYGVYLDYYCGNISYNNISLLGGNNDRGVYVSSSSNPYDIENNLVGNKITINAKSGSYGIFLSGTKGKDFIYSNNLLINGSSSIRGLSNSNNNLSIYHNLINITGTSVSDIYGIYHTGANSSFYNNSIYVNGTGVYFYSTPSLLPGSNVTKNLIRSYGGSGIKIELSSGSIFNENDISSYGGSASAILLTNSANNNSFSKNNLSSDRYRTVYISTSYNNSFLMNGIILGLNSGSTSAIYASGSDNYFANNLVNVTNSSSSEWYATGGSRNYAANMTFVYGNLTISFFDNGGSTIKSLFSTPPSTPSGKGSIGKWVNATKVGTNVNLSLNFSYSSSDLGSVSESSLMVWRYNNSWANSGFYSENGVDTDKKIVYTTITSFGSLFAPLGDVPIVGNLSCAVVYGGCSGAYAGYTDILHLSNYSDAHAEMPNGTEYSYSVCCKDINGNYNITNSSGTNFLDLSNRTDAHAALPGQGYPYHAYIGTSSGAGIRCNYLENSFGNCGGNSTCVVTLSKNASGGEENMHLASCDNEPFDYSVCCKISSLPVVSLIYPLDNSYSNSSDNIFNCSAIAIEGLLNATLFVWNSSGLYATNSSLISGTENYSSWHMNLNDGSYEWNCRAYNINNESDFASLNWTLTVDRTFPLIAFGAGTYNSGITIEDNKIIVNVSASDLNLNELTIYLYNSSRDMIDSVSNSNSSIYYEFSGLSPGLYYFNASATDLAGNENWTETRNVTLFMDAPLISFVAPTPANGTTLPYNYIPVFIEANDKNYKNYSYNLYDSSGFVASDVYYREDRGVSAGDYHTCALRSNGNITCWGWNAFNQSNNYTLGDAIGVSAEYHHTCALRSNGNITCWGYNYYGQANNYTLGDAIGVSVGGDHTCALRSNGNITCWGWNVYGQANNYTLGDAIGVSAGYSHTCALRSNGNITCWGSNSNGKANNYTLGDAIGVSAGGYHTCALRSNGNITCWGDNSNNQANNYTLGDAIGVSAGDTHTCALRRNGNITCWGDNSYNQSLNYTLGDAKKQSFYAFQFLNEGTYYLNATACDVVGNCNSTETRVYNIVGQVNPRIGLDLIYPLGDINATKDRWFNVSLNVSCFDADCGEINVSLDPVNYSLEWNVSYDSGGSNDVVYKIISNSDGTYSFVGAANYGVSDDFWLGKIDSSGNLIWNKTYDKSGYSDIAYSFVKLSNGYVIAGSSDDGGFDSVNFWVVKTDLNGNIVWDYLSNNTLGNNDIAYDIINVSDGFVVVGTRDVSFTDKIWVIKLDLSGNEVWNKTLNYSDSDNEARAVVLDSDGGYVIAGGVYSDSDFRYNPLLIKLDSNGNVLWNKIYDFGNDARLFDLEKTSDEGFAVTGYYSPAGSDILLIKLNSTGGMEWNTTYDNGDSEIGHSLKQTSDGGFVIADPTATSGGGWIIKTNSSGSIEFNQSIKNDNANVLYSIDLTSDGGFIAAGSTGGGLPWSNYDALFAKIKGEVSGGGCKIGLVSTTIGDTPFYTNESNPRTINLSVNESRVVVFWVNATGNIGTSCEFFAFANKTSNQAISNRTIVWNVTIVEEADMISPIIEITYPQNTTYKTNVSELNYSYSDAHPGYCWYSKNNGGTNSSAVSAGINFTNVVSNEGGNSWVVYCNDSYGNLNFSIVNFVKDTLAPLYFNLTETPAEPANYTPLQNYEFNATWIDSGVGVDSAWIEFNGTNYSASKNGNVYNFTKSNLGAGVYYYRWYANDSLGNLNWTELLNYTISKATPNLGISFSPSSSVTVGTETTATGTGCPSQLVCMLYREGTNVTNPDVATLAVGSYLYSYNTSGNENYTLFEINATLSVNEPSSPPDEGCTDKTWSCGEWGECINGKQTRECISNCNYKKTEEQDCCVDTSWTCTDWTECIASKQTRTCISNCNNQKEEEQSCECIPKWNCTSWSACENGEMSRNCKDLRDCNTDKDKPVERVSCRKDFVCTPEFRCGNWSECSYHEDVTNVIKGMIKYVGQRERICKDIQNCAGDYKEYENCTSNYKLSVTKGTRCNEEEIVGLSPLTNISVASINVESWKSNKLDILFMQGKVYCDWCYDGIMDFDETGVDCGGSCKECVRPTPKRWMDIIKSWLLWIIVGVLLAFIIVERRRIKYDLVDLYFAITSFYNPVKRYARELWRDIKYAMIYNT